MHSQYTCTVTMKSSLKCDKLSIPRNYVHIGQIYTSQLMPNAKTESSMPFILRQRVNRDSDQKQPCVKTEQGVVFLGSVLFKVLVRQFNIIQKVQFE